MITMTNQPISQSASYWKEIEEIRSIPNYYRTKDDYEQNFKRLERKLENTYELPHLVNGLINAIGQIVQQNGDYVNKRAFDLIKPMLNHTNDWVKAEAIKVIAEIVRKDKTVAKEAFNLMKPMLKNHSDDWVKVGTIKVIAESVRKDKTVAKEAFDLIKRMLNGMNDYVKLETIEVIAEIVRKDGAVAKEAFDLMKPMLNDNLVRDKTIKVIDEIVRQDRDVAKEAFDLIKPMLDHQDNRVKVTTVHIIGEIVLKDKTVAKEAFAQIKRMLDDSDRMLDDSDGWVHVNTISIIAEIVRSDGAFAKEAFDLVGPMQNHINGSVKAEAKKVLDGIGRKAGAVAKEVLLNDRSHEVKTAEKDFTGKSYKKNEDSIPKFQIVGDALNNQSQEVPLIDDGWYAPITSCSMLESF